MININKKLIIAWIMLVASIVLGVLSFFILPEKVIVQFSIGNNGVTTFPKLYAILLPLALGCGGALATIIKKADETSTSKENIVSAVGIAVFIIMLVVNIKL